jgi:hypothetical protein
VRDIVVEGNRRIQGPAILNRVQTKIGDPLAPAALRDDVRSIFGLGFFDDVQVRTEEFEGGVRVIFVVAERPLLREVSFEGNSEIKTEDLREKAAIRVGVLYNPVEVQKAEEAIRLKYEDEGASASRSRPARSARRRRPPGRVPDRGRAGSTSTRSSSGNKALTAGQIKDAMSTKERMYWIFPFSTVQRRCSTTTSAHPPALRRPRVRPGAGRVDRDRTHPPGRRSRCTSASWRARSSAPARSRSAGTRFSHRDIQKLITLKEARSSAGAPCATRPGDPRPLLRAGPGPG